jgi:methylated-DNA-[protein]-cysteine S-methyltransferase
LKIPFGQVSTYGDVARGMAAACGLPSMSAQAVGGAIGRNPIAILIPCHRVVGADRRLIGYAGGLDKKEALLQVECIDLATVKLYQLD